MRFLSIRIVRLAALSLLVLGALVVAVEILVRFFAPYESKAMTQLHTFFLGDGKYQEPVYDWSPIFCGMLKGRIITIDRSYIGLFAEYAGEDSWTPKPKPLKKRVGCRHELRSLPLYMSWPEMLPNENGGYMGAKSGFEGIKVGLSPQRGARKYMHAYLMHLLGDGAAKKMNEAEEVLPGIKRAYGVSMVGPEIVFWNDISSADPIVFRCAWAERVERFISCDGRYLMESEGIDVSIDLTEEKMLELPEVVQAVKQFVESHLD